MSEKPLNKITRIALAQAGTYEKLAEALNIPISKIQRSLKPQPKLEEFFFFCEQLRLYIKPKMSRDKFSRLMLDESK